jgi:hypothetical protein
MRFSCLTMVSGAISALIAIPAAAATPPIGTAAPAFTLPDSNGKPVSLANYRGKIVVIEWNNPGCPFVQKHYNSGNMQRVQAVALKQGAVWLTVNSGAAGKQGYVDGPAAAAFLRDQKARPTAYLLDHKGDVGRSYGATATPGMYVVDASGRLAYSGAIDDKPTANPADIAKARNLVLAAVGDLKAGRAVATPQTRAYGCSVKYAD